jgi:hypothetical protein
LDASGFAAGAEGEREGGFGFLEIPLEDDPLGEYFLSPVFLLPP